MILVSFQRAKKQVATDKRSKWRLGSDFSIQRAETWVTLGKKLNGVYDDVLLPMMDREVLKLELSLLVHCIDYKE